MGKVSKVLAASLCFLSALAVVLAVIVNKDSSAIGLTATLVQAFGTGVGAHTLINLGKNLLKG